MEVTHRSYLGDTAAWIAVCLDGTWKVEVGNLGMPSSDAQDRLEYAWSNGPLLDALRTHGDQMSAAAFLTHDDGRELVVTRRPSDQQILVGAVAPDTEHLTLDLDRPDSIVAATSFEAAKKVTQTLLPSYDRTMVQAHQQMLDTTLARVREARHSSRQPEMLPLAKSLRAHAPYLIRHLRSTGSPPSSAQSATVLDRAEEALAADPPTDVPSAAQMLEQWLDHGTRVTEMVRSLDPHPEKCHTAPPGPPRVPSDNSAVSSPGQ